jgi:hypothetical protein
VQFPKQFPWQERIDMTFPDNMTLRCVNPGCSDPRLGIGVIAEVAIYLDAEEHIENQGDDTHYERDSAAWCRNCDCSGTYSDFEFRDSDFLIFPRSLKDY